MLISISGDLGSGKTLLATYFALKSKHPIFANYKINVKNYNPLTPEKLIEINEQSLIILDEAYTWLESRTSGKEINKYMSYILFQSRKRKIDFILTSQLYATVDLRFRRLTDLKIYAIKKDNGFYYLFTKNNNQYQTYHMNNNFAQQIFPYYDTFEKIDPIDQDMIFRISHDKSTNIEEINNISKMLIEKFQNIQITKPIIQDFVLQHNYPKTYQELIYNRIKHLQAKNKINKQPF